MRRTVHDVSRAHAIIRALDAEKVHSLLLCILRRALMPCLAGNCSIAASAGSREVCHDLGERSRPRKRRALCVCPVPVDCARCRLFCRHGLLVSVGCWFADTPLQGKELSPADFHSRLASSATPAPANAGQSAAWEASIDPFWERRLADGDPAQSCIGARRVDEDVTAFIEASVKQIEDSKCAALFCRCFSFFSLVFAVGSVAQCPTVGSCL